MIKQRTSDWHGGVNIKRSIYIHTWEAQDQPDSFGFNPAIPGTNTGKGLLVGLSNGEVRLRYPDYSYSKVQRLTGASEDLKCLCALFVCELVPAGVLADKLTEELPQHEQAAEILREYEKVKQKEQEETRRY